MDFKGVGVALVTPFDSENSVDYTALQNIVNMTIEGGVDFLVTMGTTGETPTLSDTEKTTLLARTREFIAGRVPLVIGLGGNDTAAVVQQVKSLDTSLADAILTVCPYYNKPTQEGLFAHFDAIAEASPVPIILYNVPGRTSSNILPDTVLRLAQKHSNIIAIKEASGNLPQIMQIVQNKPEGFHVLSGDDDLVLPELAMGVEGVISVVANALPEKFSKMVHAGMQGDVSIAKGLHYEMVELIWMLFEQGNPAGVKYALKTRAMCQPYVRLPLMGIDDDLSARISAAMAKLL